MKQKFSIKWKGSKQPRKQRKYLANAPIHVRHKLVSCNLNKDLRKKYRKRNFPLRKNDTVKVMKGEFKGKTGKVDLINLKKIRVMIEGIYRTKKDGTKVSVYFSPSNLQIKELNLEDGKRKKALERKATSEKEDNKKTDKEKQNVSKKK